MRIPQETTVKVILSYISSLMTFYFFTYFLGWEGGGGEEGEGVRKEGGNAEDGLEGAGTSMRQVRFMPRVRACEGYSLRAQM